MMKVNDIHLHYRVDGPDDGVPVVFANSLGTDLRVFEALLPLLKGKLRFIRYDKRGHGLSDATPRPYRMSDHVADLAGLLDALKVRQAVIVGLSIGGLIALGLSASRPDLVRAIVLMDSAHKIGNDEMWNGRIDVVEKGGIAAIEKGVLERWFPESFRTGRSVELAGWRNMLTRTTVDGYAGSSAAIRDANYEAAARGLKVPVLGIGGSHDLATPPDLVKGTIAIIPGARFVLIDGSGHLPCVDAPAKVAAAMNDFFAENGIG
ncbi:MAG: 3-oxoadipate enol-lactonase [Bauldia sp.]